MGSPLAAATDIYSLGLVLLECIKQTVEYPGSAVESAVARLHRAPEIPADLPAEWADLIRSMTAIEPLERPSAADVETVLRQALVSPASTPGELAPETTRVLPAMPFRPPSIAITAESELLWTEPARASWTCVACGFLTREAGSRLVRFATAESVSGCRRPGSARRWSRRSGTDLQPGTPVNARRRPLPHRHRHLGRPPQGTPGERGTMSPAPRHAGACRCPAWRPRSPSARRIPGGLRSGRYRPSARRRPAAPGNASSASAGGGRQRPRRRTGSLGRP